MKKVLVLLNHKLIQEQIETLRLKYGVKKENIIYPSKEITLLWSGIDPKSDKIPLEEIKNFILANFKKYDLVIVQGETGATFKIVNFCFANNLIPIYATTKRTVILEENINGIVEKKSVFKFVRFREYEREE